MGDLNLAIKSYKLLTTYVYKWTSSEESVPNILFCMATKPSRLNYHKFMPGSLQ